MTEAQAQVGYFCSRCSQYNVYSMPLAAPATGSASESTAGTCGKCGHWDEPKLTNNVVKGGRLEKCPQCENLELYTRKDFPQQLGCAAVVATVTASSIAYAVWDFPAALAVLVLASVFDFALYYRLREVTICYRCHAEMRGFASNPAHGPFDMHRAEEYEHETP